MLAYLGLHPPPVGALTPAGGSYFMRTAAAVSIPPIDSYNLLLVLAVQHPGTSWVCGGRHGVLGSRQLHASARSSL